MSVKRNVFAIIMAAVFAGISFVAYAAGGASGDHIISYVEITADGGIIIESATPFNNPDQCANPNNNNNRIIIRPDNQFINRYYAAVLTAYSGDDYIWAYLNGCWTTPWNPAKQYPIVQNAATRGAP